MTTMRDLLTSYDSAGAITTTDYHPATVEQAVSAHLITLLRDGSGRAMITVEGMDWLERAGL